MASNRPVVSCRKNQIQADQPIALRRNCGLELAVLGGKSFRKSMRLLFRNIGSFSVPALMTLAPSSAYSAQSESHFPTGLFVPIPDNSPQMTVNASGWGFWQYCGALLP